MGTVASALATPTGRRGVLKLMAAGLALAGPTGCDDGAPDGVLIAPVLPPADAVAAGSACSPPPGCFPVTLTASWCGMSMGGLSRSRATPLHPASLDGTGPIGQAESLGFYDPDRSRGLSRAGEPRGPGRHCSPRSLRSAKSGRRSTWPAKKEQSCEGVGITAREHLANRMQESGRPNHVRIA
jgi:hypothetical protein